MPRLPVEVSHDCQCYIYTICMPCKGSPFSSTAMAKTVHLLDYVAGNIRSLANAIEMCGYDVEWIKSPEDMKKAEV
jgi:hypothetical protein